MSYSTKAAYWAAEKHKETNHLYDGKAYSVHLWQVHDTAKMFLHLIDAEDHDTVLSACFLHDTIEDCRVTYNDVKAEFGTEITEIVYALTNDKGRNRQERAGLNYYKGIRANPLAVFVKLCDRIANSKHSLESGSSMYGKYQQEYYHFLGAMGGYENFRPM